MDEGTYHEVEDGIRQTHLKNHAFRLYTVHARRLPPHGASSLVVQTTGGRDCERRQKVGRYGGGSKG